MIRRVVVIMAASLLFAAATVAQQDVRELFERARLLDENNQNLREAIRLYGQVVEDAEGQRALAARAEFRIGILYERLGRSADAQRAFRTVISRYPDQTEVAQRARLKIVDRNDHRDQIPFIRKTGPSADASYVETFTLADSTN